MAEERVTFLTTSEAAGYLGVSLHTLRTMESEGNLIPFRTLDGHCGYSLRMLNEYLGQSYEPPHHQKPESESEVRDVSLPPASELQSQGSPLAAPLLPDEAEQEPPESEAQSAEPLPLQPSSPPSDLTSLSDVTKEKMTILTEREAENPTEAKSSTARTVDSPTTPIRVLPKDPIEVLGLSARSLNGLMRASIRTIGELQQAIESGILPWFVSGIGPKSVTEIEDNLTRVQLVDAPEPPDESATPLPDDSSIQASASATQTADVPAIQMHVLSEDSIELLGLSKDSLDALKRASFLTIWGLLKAVESGTLAIYGIGPESMAEIEDSLARVRLVDAPESIDESGAPSTDGTSTVRDISPLPVPEIQDQSSPPIDVLNLSTRSYNFLKRSGLHTVAQVAALSDDEILAIRQVGPKALTDIREKLAVYLAEHPLSDEVKESPLEPEPQPVAPPHRNHLPHYRI